MRGSPPSSTRPCSGSGPEGDRVRRRDRGRRDGGRADAGARVLQGGARGLRPSRVPPDPGRGDVRYGPHRHAARLRAGRCRARPPGDREGAGRRLPADRRRAGPGTDRRRDGKGERLLPARPHLSRPPGRLRGGARRAERDRARRAARARARARGAASGRGSAADSTAIRTSATSAAAACSAGSSWCGTGRRSPLSTRRSSCTCG